MKKAICMFILLFVSWAAANLMQTAQTLSEIEHSVIRLHILADSDSTADQTAKLLVRDALLAQAGDWIPAGADYDVGCAALTEKLPEIQAAAETALRQNGNPDSVRVSFAPAMFPARQYGRITLPAGEYRALRVEIGEAEGQNWWCVMYPAMCVPAAAETVPEDVLNEDACDMAEHPEEYEVRLKCVDMLRAVRRQVSAFVSGL